MWQLTAKHGRRKGRSWPIADEAITIGRNPSCSIKLNDPLVSREHCRVYEENDNLEVFDLGSANSTLVNGSPVSRCTLALGDELVIGEATFVVTRTTPADPGTATGTPIGLNTTQSLPADLQGGIAGQTPGSDSLTVSELALAHRFASSAAACSNSHELFEQLVRCVYDHCSPANLFVSTERDTEKLLSHPTGFVPDPLVRDALNSHLENRIADPKFIRRTTSDGDEVFTSFIPLRVGDQFVGILGGDQFAADSDRTEPDLNFAVNLSRILAPFLLAFTTKSASSPVEQTSEVTAAFLGSSPPAEEARRLIAIASTADVPILIQGETGTGKELAANLIHLSSEQRDGPFVASNCAAINDELFESEVFGHVKGAFTGAIADRTGLLAEANGGHLFLDEIADLSLRNQARLLRAIELQRFRSVGASKDSESNFRLISASNRDLWQEVEAGRFRADLYYRLAGIELFLPPLSERRSDIPELVAHFANEATDDRHTAASMLNEGAMEYMTGQPWHGNVRELRNSIHKLATFAQGRTLSKSDVEQLLARRSQSAKQPVQQIRDVEREHIERVLAECGGRIQDAAKVLGIHRNTLSKKLKEYGRSA